MNKLILATIISLLSFIVGQAQEPPDAPEGKIGVEIHCHPKDSGGFECHLGPEKHDPPGKKVPEPKDPKDPHDQAGHLETMMASLVRQVPYQARFDWLSQDPAQEPPACPENPKGGEKPPCEPKEPEPVDPKEPGEPKDPDGCGKQKDGRLA